MDFLSLTDEEFEKRFEEISESSLYKKADIDRQSLRGRGALATTKVGLTADDFGGATSEDEYAEQLTEAEKEIVGNAEGKTRKKREANSAKIKEQIIEQRRKLYQDTIKGNENNKAQLGRDRLFMSLLFNWYEQISRISNTGVKFEEKSHACDIAKDDIKGIMGLAREHMNLNMTAAQPSDQPEAQLEGGEGRQESPVPMYKATLEIIKQRINSLKEVMNILSEKCRDENEKVLYDTIGEVTGSIGANIDGQAEASYNSRELVTWSSILERSQEVRSSSKTVASLLSSSELYVEPQRERVEPARPVPQEHEDDERQDTESREDTQPQERGPQSGERQERSVVGAFLARLGIGRQQESLAPVEIEMTTLHDHSLDDEHPEVQEDGQRQEQPVVHEGDRRQEQPVVHEGDRQQGQPVVHEGEQHYDKIDLTKTDISFENLKSDGSAINSDYGQIDGTGFKLSPEFKKDISNIMISDSLMGLKDREPEELIYTYKITRDEHGVSNIEFQHAKAVIDETSQEVDTEHETKVVRDKGGEYGFALPVLDKSMEEKIVTSSVSDVRTDLLGMMSMKAVEKFLARFLLLKLSIAGMDMFANEPEDKKDEYFALINEHYPGAVPKEGGVYTPKVEPLKAKILSTTAEWQSEDAEKMITVNQEGEEGTDPQNMLDRFVRKFMAETSLKYIRALRSE